MAAQRTPWSRPKGRREPFALVTLVFLSACRAPSDIGPSSREPVDEPKACIPPRCRLLRADGTVDITVEEAWPERGEEPTPVSAEEVARACVERARCLQGAGLRYTDLRSCVGGDGPWEGAERRAQAVSFSSYRWDFMVRGIVAHPGDCSVALRADVDAKPLLCPSSGCYLTSRAASISCSGAVADINLGGSRVLRDCAQSFTQCDPQSATGCTDRRSTTCSFPAKARCDGDIRIACKLYDQAFVEEDPTEIGYLTFEDCSRVGAICKESGCEYVRKECDPAMPYSCEGGDTILCLRGVRVRVAQEELGEACVPPGEK